MSEDKSEDKLYNKDDSRYRLAVRLTTRYMELLDTLVQKGVYNSRNEAIRDALRSMYEHHGLDVSS